MELSDLRNLFFTTGEIAGFRKKAPRTISGYCDLPNDDPDRMPCRRTGQNEKREVFLLDLIRHLIRENDKAAADRLLAHLLAEHKVDSSMLRFLLVVERIDLTLFPLTKEVVFFIGLTHKEKGRVSYNYDQSLYEIKLFDDVFDATELIAQGLVPNFIALDLGEIGVSTGLLFLSYLRRKPACEKTIVLLAIPVDGLACTLPDGVLSFQRPIDAEEPILAAFPPKESPAEQDAQAVVPE